MKKKAKIKSCPVGLICFQGKHLIIILSLVTIVLLVYLVSQASRTNTPRINQFSAKQNNKIINRNNTVNTNNTVNRNNTVQRNNTVNRNNTVAEEVPEIKINSENIKLNKLDDTNITINFSGHPTPQIPDTSTYLVNKDHERITNPLLPPERRNFHIDSTGLERVVAPVGIPINVPTRGYTGGMVQVGVLHKEEVNDATKTIGQNSEPVILPLFGRPTHNGSNKWSYYTATDKYNQVKLPISNKNKVCNSEYGCEELYEGDTVSVPAYNGNFKVSIYEFDKPRYIPFV